MFQASYRPANVKRARIGFSLRLISKLWSFLWSVGHQKNSRFRFDMSKRSLKWHWNHMELHGFWNLKLAAWSAWEHPGGGSLKTKTLRIFDGQKQALLLECEEEIPNPTVVRKSPKSKHIYMGSTGVPQNHPFFCAQPHSNDSGLIILDHVLIWFITPPFVGQNGRITHLLMIYFGEANIEMANPWKLPSYILDFHIKPSSQS